MKKFLLIMFVFFASVVSVNAQTAREAQMNKKISCLRRPFCKAKVIPNKEKVVYFQQDSAKLTDGNKQILNEISPNTEVIVEATVPIHPYILSDYANYLFWKGSNYEDYKIWKSILSDCENNFILLWMWKGILNPYAYVPKLANIWTYKISVSQKRANNVAAYLKSRGVTVTVTGVLAVSDKESNQVEIYEIRWF